MYFIVGSPSSISGPSSSLENGKGGESLLKFSILLHERSEATMELHVLMFESFAKVACFFVKETCILAGDELFCYQQCSSHQVCCLT